MTDKIPTNDELLTEADRIALEQELGSITDTFERELIRLAREAGRQEERQLRNIAYKNGYVNGKKDAERRVAGEIRTAIMAHAVCLQYHEVHGNKFSCLDCVLDWILKTYGVPDTKDCRTQKDKVEK
jgi:hypothetical protein